MTEEEVKMLTNQYLTSKRLFKLRGPEFVNVARDRLLMDTVLCGKGGVRAGLLKERFMNTNEVTNRIVNSTEPWYKIYTGDGQLIAIGLVVCFWLRHSAHS